MNYDYKPYQEEWQSEISLKDFIIWLTFQLSTFENNINKEDLHVIDYSKEEWMDMFLLWSEYATDYSKL
jgi:hypothetical protein